MTKSLVIGLGLSGLALARFLAARGDRVTVADTKDRQQLADQVARLPEGVELALGGYGDLLLLGVDEVYASPGVPWDDSLLRAARRRGIRVSSELDLFFRHCPAPIVGITGTNGKTTTTALTGAVLASGDRPVIVGGNIGETVLDRLAQVTPEHVVVLELSSFQLESIERPHAHVGVVLNVTPDHLDRHGTFHAYAAAKARLVQLLEPSDFAVLNSEDLTCRTFAQMTRGRVVWFDHHRPPPPMPVPGRHNLMNALAAAAVGRLMGLDDEQINTAVAGFGGVEHRLELVGDWDGVRWYNDSKATNPDAGRVALAAFGGTPLVLIAGGHGGGFDLGDWLADIRRLAATVIVIGESAPELERELTAAGHPDVRRARDLDHAVELAAAAAAPGSVVLLSPGFKSFDWFTSFEDRGRRFKTSVIRHQSRKARR